MSDEFSILIADRNRHVREFLQRELRDEGYRVLIARDGCEVKGMVDGHDPPDLLILDLEIPNLSGSGILELLEERKSSMPVVVHTFPTDYTSYLGEQSRVVFVEKSGSTDHLKAVIFELLRKCYPLRFVGCKEQDAERVSEQ